MNYFQISIEKGTFDLKSVGTQLEPTGANNGGANIRSGPYYSFDSSEANQGSITITATANINSTGGFALNPGQWSLWDIRLMDKNANYLIYKWNGVYSTFSATFCDTHSFFDSSAIFEIVNN